MELLIRFLFAYLLGEEGAEERGCQELSSRRGCRHPWESSVGDVALQEARHCFPCAGAGQRRKVPLMLGARGSHGSRTSLALWGRGHPISQWRFPRGTPASMPLLALGRGKSPVFSALPLYLNGKQHSLFTNVHHQSFKDAWFLFDSKLL